MPVKTHRALIKLFILLFIVAAAAQPDSFASTITSNQTQQEFTLGEQIGSGGLGTVYVAALKTQQRKPRPVAFKHLNPEYSDYLDAIKRNSSAARSLCPKLCPLGLHEIIDVGEFSPKRAWLERKVTISGVVSELGNYDGSHLTAYLNVLATLKGKEFQNAKNQFTVLSALLSYMSRFQAAMARYGYALNDIKPNNLLVSQDWRLLFTDFDALAQLGKKPIARTLTFAAPEIVDGPANEKSDLFAIGNTMLYWVTGGQTLLDVVWFQWPNLKPRLLNTQDMQEEIRAVKNTYKWLEENDPQLQQTLQPKFEDILIRFDGLAGPENSRAMRHNRTAVAKHFLDGLRKSLAIRPADRQHYTHPKTLVTDEQLIHHFLQDIDGQNCDTSEEESSKSGTTLPTVPAY